MVYYCVICLPAWGQSANTVDQQKDLIIKVFNVGYGDAILLIPPRSSPILVDTGSEDHVHVIVDWLKENDVDHIGSLIITHPHDDHFGGALRLLDAVSFKKFYYNGDDQQADQGFDQLMAKIMESGIPVRVLKKDDRLSFKPDDFSITTLHPQTLDHSANENSMVLLLRYKEISVLLTADIQPRQQLALLKIYPALAETDAVQIPHHGGRLDDSFARLMNNKIIFMSTGPNEYQKPYKEEIEKVSGRIFRTDLQGMITLTTNGYDIKVSTENE